MKEAKINCPHCGKAIRVRQADAADQELAAASDKVWAAGDSLFKQMEKLFDKVFGK